MKKRIVYIPTYPYSSHPIFFNISKASANKFINIYFNPKDPFLAKWQKESIKKEEILEYFNEYHEVDNKFDSFLVNYLKTGTSSKLIGFPKFIKHLKNYKKNYERKIKEIKPNAIISSSDQSVSSKICNLWAYNKNIPFFVIQPTFIDYIVPTIAVKIKRKILYLLLNKLLHLPLINRQYIFGNEKKNNYIFLWGEAFKVYYRDLRIVKNVFLVGNPAFDSISSEKSKSTIIKNLDLNKIKNKPVITICTEALEGLVPEEDIFYINSIYKKVIEQNDDLFFLIKVHPREDTKKYKDLFSEIHTTNFLIVRDANLYDIFKITEVQISVNSYSSLEAVIFHIPIILVKKDLIKSYDWFNNEVELTANNYSELNANIRKCLTKNYMKKFEEKRAKYLKSIIGNLDNKSSLRIISKIDSLLERN